jgi:hypothetical protein
MRPINFLGNDAAGIPAYAAASAGRVAESPKCIGMCAEGLAAPACPVGRDSQPVCPNFYFLNFKF